MTNVKHLSVTVDYTKEHPVSFPNQIPTNNKGWGIAHETLKRCNKSESLAWKGVKKGRPTNSKICNDELLTQREEKMKI